MLCQTQREGRTKRPATVAVAVCAGMPGVQHPPKPAAINGDPTGVPGM